MPQASAQIHECGWNRRQSPERSQAVPSRRAVDVKSPTGRARGSRAEGGETGLLELARGHTRDILDHVQSPDARVAASCELQHRSKHTRVFRRPLSHHCYWALEGTGHLNEDPQRGEGQRHGWPGPQGPGAGWHFSASRESRGGGCQESSEADGVWV